MIWYFILIFSTYAVIKLTLLIKYSYRDDADETWYMLYACMKPTFWTYKDFLWEYYIYQIEK